MLLMVSRGGEEAFHQHVLRKDQVKSRWWLQLVKIGEYLPRISVIRTRM